MILVDTSVWIDFLRGTATPQAEWLDRHLGIEPIVIGDLILAEVLQGFRHDKGFEAARRLFAPLAQLQIGGSALAVEAARNCRRLRAAGFTVRGTVDALIATCCITENLLLLHDDRDFDVFEQQLGLRAVDCGA